MLDKSIDRRIDALPSVARLTRESPAFVAMVVVRGTTIVHERCARSSPPSPSRRRCPRARDVFLSRRGTVI